MSKSHSKAPHCQLSTLWQSITAQELNCHDPWLMCVFVQNVYIRCDRSPSRVHVADVTLMIQPQEGPYCNFSGHILIIRQRDDIAIRTQYIQAAKAKECGMLCMQSWQVTCSSQKSGHREEKDRVSEVKQSAELTVLLELTQRGMGVRQTEVVREGIREKKTGERQTSERNEWGWWGGKKREIENEADLPLP